MRSALEDATRIVHVYDPEQPAAKVPRVARREVRRLTTRVIVADERQRRVTQMPAAQRVTRRRCSPSTSLHEGRPRCPLYAVSLQRRVTRPA